MNQEQVIAIVRLVCTFVASIATTLGIAWDSDAIFTVVCAALTVVCFVWSWWKNNNLTTAAQEAQKLLDDMKREDA